MTNRINAARVFAALGDPTRRAIVEKVSERPASVSRLASECGVTLTAIGQHLRALEECNLVRTEKIGRVRTCQLDGGGLAALEAWVRDRRSLWERRLDRLGDVLGDED